MGMDPFNFADAILCILAQRLVRTTCVHCRQPYPLSKDARDELAREYGSPDDFEKHLDIPNHDDVQLYRPKGCDRCYNTGYAGRIALHELLRGTDEMKKLIQNSSSVEAIRRQAVKDGMKTLKQDGIEKIINGHCDLLQIRKVCMK
jgi:type II secretory ATPase GspE/PulE/Tfp pilus assembly ATPase PilB-like protein